jgi:ribosomal protein S18 acetylase RimI-like enzyme
MQVKFQEILSVKNNYFKQAMLIYDEAFPSNEKHPIDLIQNRIINGHSKLYVGIIDGEVVCMSLIWNFNDLEFVLLDYMAVSSNYRNNNLGSQLFQFLSNRVRKLNKYMIIEVENYLFGSNTLERKRRINFYFKNGAYILEDFNYLLPSLDGTYPTEMILMVSPKYKEDILKGEQIKELVIRLYVDLYEKNTSDKLLNTILNKTPNKIKLNNKLL